MISGNTRTCGSDFRSESRVKSKGGSGVYLCRCDLAMFLYLELACGFDIGKKYSPERKLSTSIRTVKDFGEVILVRSNCFAFLVNLSVLLYTSRQM